ncbi:MAG: DNA polymerase III subunit beta [Planctomycetaceae bacterium]|nr:DNA polymerase III subunit beta [Planctomycetaceae bacterium]
MEFTINKNQFSEALSLVAAVVPERSARAILQNLMLTGNEDSTITLSATDLEIGLQMTLDVTGMQNPSQVLLPASRLNALVKGSFADELQISIQDYKAEIRTRQGRFQVPGLDVMDYPSISEFEGNSVFIHGDDFADAVQKTVFATAKGDTRYALNGIYININEGSAEFVASDTHRLSLVSKKVRNPDAVQAEGILLTKGMTTLARLAAGAEVVELAVSATEMVAKTANAIISIRRVEGMFPRYHDVIPPKSDMHVTVKKDELLRSLHSIGLMSSDESKSVLFAIADGALTLSASSENGEGNLTLDAETVGAPMEIKFNFTFLVDVLKNIAEDQVTIQFKDADNPARVDSGDFMYVIMPINR